MRSKASGVLFAALVVVLAAGFVLWRTGLAERVDPDALWKVVNGLCVPDERANHAPVPCVAVDLAAGYAVLRDARGATQVLVIPTAKVTGVEDPAVRAPGAPNYWQDAWAARVFVERLARRPIPRDDLLLAVNSVYGRTQNQLHIHVDCIRPDVKAALAARLDAIGPHWSELPVLLRGRRYRVLWIPGADLGAANPFALAAASDPAPATDMSAETLALAPVVRAAGAPGFVLLADHAGRGYDGHAESLQDHRCRVLRAG